MALVPPLALLPAHHVRLPALYIVRGGGGDRRRQAQSGLGTVSPKNLVITTLQAGGPDLSWCWWLACSWSAGALSTRLCHQSQILIMSALLGDHDCCHATGQHCCLRPIVSQAEGSTQGGWRMRWPALQAWRWRICAVPRRAASCTRGLPPRGPRTLTLCGRPPRA